MKFEDLLREHRIEYRTEGHHHCRPGWIQLDCPYCRSRGKWHLGYNVTFGYANCWKCGRHRINDILRELTDLPWRKVKKLLEGVERQPLPLPIERNRLRLPSGIEPLAAPHRKYLERRGFDVAELQQLWDIQGIGLGGAGLGLQWRLFVPIHFYGTLVSWTTRSLSERHPKKYRTAKPDEEAMNHHHILYGEDYCRTSILIFEGPPDVWRVGPGAVCTFGTQFSSAQIARIVNYPVRVVCFDNEEIAQQRAQRLGKRLNEYDGKTFNVMLNRKGQDIDMQEVNELRKKFL
jgi:hypothetical protein